jgi:hypothetical protein
MKTTILALLFLPATALAASALDGTWKMRADSLKVSGKPDEFAIAGGMFTCPSPSCDPPLNVKADGTDQKVSGHDYYDAIAIKVVDASTVQETRKRAGKIVSTVTLSVSADGKTLHGKFVDYNGEKPASATFTQKRVAAGPAGSHAVSGAWLQSSVSDANDALTTVTYHMGADGFSMDANGQTYKAKFDGKEYPVEGDPGKTVVTLQKVDANTVVETDHRAGKTTDEIRIAAAGDGKSITVTDRDLVHGQTSTMTLDKQ